MTASGNNKRPDGRKKGQKGRRSKGRRKPVPLHKRSSSHFRPATRDRGTAHHESGRVDLQVEGTRGLASVEEEGGETHAVGLDWSRVEKRRALHAFCDCDTFAKGTPCEHVWAALMALTVRGSEVQPPGADRVSLRRDRPERWKELGAASSRSDGGQRQESRRGGGRRGGGRPRSWQARIATLREEVGKSSPAAADAAEGNGHRDLRFLINTEASLEGEGLVLDVFSRRRGPGGKPGRLRRTSIEPRDLVRIILPESQEEEEAIPPVAVVPALGDAGQRGRGPRGKSRAPTRVQQFRLPQELYAPVLSHLSSEGSLGWWDGRRIGSGQPLSWDVDPPWTLALRLEESGGQFMRLRGSLERNGESVPVTSPPLILPTGTTSPPLVLFTDAIARLELESQGDLRWIDPLRETGDIAIPKGALEEALTELLEVEHLPRLELPDGVRLSEETAPAKPRLVLRKDATAVLADSPLLAELSFIYGDMEVSAGDARATVIDWKEGNLVRRDMDAEHTALVRLLEAGVEPLPDGEGHELRLPPDRVPAVAETLLLADWTVEVTGTTLRAPSRPTLRIESGIDWFELGGGVEFPGSEVDLSRILDAVSKGDRFLELEDGSRGLLPSAWSETYDSLSKLSQGATEDGLRFLPSQALLVDALLTEMPAAAVDETFARLREKLQSFDRIKPKKEPRGFNGTLRAYQREGLGWLAFLREFGLGGVLADDMGLGKTVQVLALLRSFRTPSKTTGLPWLVVVPRSLLYNWMEEAARFVPKLEVVEYGGPGREALRSELGDYDLVLTTYGTLRRDVSFLVTVEFDTIVLDEAQAIKNRESLGAKAARSLRGQNRLALTGTPIENHLGELGSLFEFLNPGLLGRLPPLEVLSSGRQASKGELEQVAEGIRPFILRRTKAQVLPDLPPKTEQALHCTLNERQRELYDQLRAGYQESLLRQAETEGMSGTTIQVLEALLRLRQIACHPGLVKEEWAEAGSAKLDTLFELLDEVLDEGHKVIVFSQFTKLLALVREGVEERRIGYAYLDGQTRKRGEVVERFQTDPECNLFLISLKAGGVGLNLTAAGYVFLLDPWWNPAVEAQAIDRAHRIGQTQPVFAYRLIARDTVEEKILELQRSKRKIADAILEGEGGPLSELTAEDLKLLLS